MWVNLWAKDIYRHHRLCLSAFSPFMTVEMLQRIFLKVNEYNHQSAESITWYDNVPHWIHLNIHTTNNNNSNKQQHTVAAFNNRSQRPQFYTSDITLIRFLLQLYNRNPPKWHNIRIPIIQDTYIHYSISNYTWNNLYIFRKASFILLFIIVMLHFPTPQDKIRSPFRK